MFSSNNVAISILFCSNANNNGILYSNPLFSFNDNSIDAALLISNANGYQVIIIKHHFLYRIGMQNEQTTNKTLFSNNNLIIFVFLLLLTLFDWDLMIKLIEYNNKFSNFGIE